ncbi:MAG: hypothetical protein KGY60_12060 [Bacteroidales bacterium]|nr:hypothetical protein [Bacteroidales bacterium]
MNRWITYMVMIQAILLMSITGVVAQQDTASTARDSKGNEVPPALRKIVEQYEEKVKSDTLIDQGNDPSDRDFVLNNLVMDETLSKMGHDFYRFFNDNWNPPETDESFTIYINEMPSPGMGNMIQVKINYDEIFRQRISPKQDYIKQLAQMAVRQSENYIANYEQIKQQLEGEDMQGTGIY